MRNMQNKLDQRTWASDISLMMEGTNLESESEVEPKVLRVLQTQIMASSRTRHNLWLKADGATRSNTYCGEEISMKPSRRVWDIKSEDTKVNVEKMYRNMH